MSLETEANTWDSGAWGVRLALKAKCGRIREALSIAAVVAVCALAACQRVVEIPDLRPASEIDLPEFRRADLALPDNKDTPRSYTLTGADIVQFSWRQDSRRFHRITLAATQCTEEGCEPCKAAGIPNEAPLLTALRPRLSISTLSSMSSLVVRDPDGEAVVPTTFGTIDFCTAGYSPIDPARRITWGGLSDMFARKAVVPSLLAEPLRHALPGDLVRVTVLSRFGESPDVPSPFQGFQTETRVDERGEIFVPALATATELNQIVNTGPVVRRAVGSIDDSNLRIRVWDPGISFADQISLQLAASCLSAAWSRSDTVDPPASPSLDREARRCIAAGVEGPLFRPEVNEDLNITRVRYRLDVEQTWTLIGEDGERSEQPFRPGNTIGSAVSLAVRELTGRELVARSGFNRRIAYVSVIPRAELGPGVNSQPFSGAIAAGSQSTLDSILLAPGDVVHVTRREPR